MAGIAEARGVYLADVVREALDEHIARHRQIAGQGIGVTQ